MRTRCPHCATVFRVSAEALKVRAGTVRCGRCRGVFNALDQLIDEEAAARRSEPAGGAAVGSAGGVEFDQAVRPAGGEVAEQAPAIGGPSDGAADEATLRAAGVESGNIGGGETAAPDADPSTSAATATGAADGQADGQADEQADEQAREAAPAETRESAAYEPAASIEVKATMLDFDPAMVPAEPSPDAADRLPAAAEAEVPAGTDADAGAAGAATDAGDSAEFSLKAPVDFTGEAFDALPDKVAGAAPVAISFEVPAGAFAAVAEDLPAATAGPDAAADTAEVTIVATASATPARQEPTLDDGSDALRAAQDAGLVAARDTREMPGYSKWAEGTLSAPSATFDEAPKTGWMLVVVNVVLALMLLVQAMHYWRTDLANRWPELRPWLEEGCAAIRCTVPYPRELAAINLEASDLQVDRERGGLLALNLTIKNRAPYPQEFPALELTLTDARENVVVRRVLPPAEWLPPKIDEQPTPPAFPADREIAARLWIDAQDSGAAGYRLAVFYP